MATDKQQGLEAPTSAFKMGTIRAVRRRGIIVIDDKKDFKRELFNAQEGDANRSSPKLNSVPSYRCPTSRPPLSPRGRAKRDVLMDNQISLHCGQGMLS